MEPKDYKELILSFIYSLTLCDHMGDVADDIHEMLDRLDVNVEWNKLSELRDILVKMGIDSIY